MGSSICGGVISEGQLKRGMKKYGIHWGMMSFVMPDKQYKEWVDFKKQRKDKEAKELFDKFAMSQI